jgi:hypothetical protein
MSNSIKFLSIIIFTVGIWSINSFLSPILSAEIKNINTLKKELSVKQSFSDGAPANLKKNVNEFVLEKFDKNQLVNLVDSFSKQSAVEISSLDIQVDKPDKNVSNADNLDSNTSLSTDTNSTVNKSNTLKSVKMVLNINGNKMSIDSFLSKLVKSKQYIDIQDISLSFIDSPNSVSGSKSAQSTIIAKVYYINL